MRETDITGTEVDQSKEVDDLHTKLPDGRVILKSRRVFRYRKAETKTGIPAEVDIRGKVYIRVGGALVNVTPKMSKAEKKATKRAKVAAMKGGASRG